jgi:hypothetical protein
VLMITTDSKCFGTSAGLKKRSDPQFKCDKLLQFSLIKPIHSNTKKIIYCASYITNEMQFFKICSWLNSVG